MDTLLFIGVVAYGVTTCAYLAALWRASPRVAQWSTRLLMGALAYWTGILGYGLATGDPWVGTQPWLWLSAWGLALVYLLLSRRYPLVTLGSFVIALSTILVTLGLFAERPYQVLMAGPVADWLLGIHIALAFIGIVAFALAAFFSGAYLVRARQLKSKRKGPSTSGLPSLADLDRLSLRSVIVGFPFYTVALLLGSAQAVRQGIESIHLTYVLASFSWLIYAIVLQARLAAGWRGRRAAISTIIGLVIAMAVVTMYSLRNG